MQILFKSYSEYLQNFSLIYHMKKIKSKSEKQTEHNTGAGKGGKSKDGKDKAVLQILVQNTSDLN